MCAPIRMYLSAFKPKEFDTEIRRHVPNIKNKFKLTWTLFSHVPYAERHDSSC